MNMPIGSPQPKKHHFLRTIIVSTAVVWFVFFAGWVVYYLWQGKYGTAENIAKINQEFQSDKFTTASDTTEAPHAPSDWSTYLTPNNPTTGNQKSSIQVVAFIDFECPFSQAGYSLFKSIIDTYGSAVKVTIKQLPLVSIHAHALPAAEAVECAQEQGKFWPYYNYLFTNKKLSDADLTAAAAAVTMDVPKFTACIDSHKYQNVIEKDVNDAIALGVRGTPTYFINSQVIEGVAERSVWDTIILDNLKK
jgi:protein-disulfide isomerase